MSGIKKYVRAGMVAHAWDLILGRQRQEDCHEIEASLVSTVSSKPAKNYISRSHQKENKKIVLNTFDPDFKTYRNQVLKSQWFL